MNQEDFVQLTYGTIIQLDDKSNKYKDKFFFISYICKDYIDLLSNDQLQQIKIIIENNNQLLKINEDIIDGIRVYYQPKLGYAQLNNLYPGTRVDIVYMEETNFEIMRGTIIDLVEDQITIENDNNEYFYIDFKYAGLDKSSIIEINIISTEKQRVFSSYKSDNLDDEYDEINTYDMSEEISNYLEKMSLTQKNKKIIINEIKKYFQLIDIYTDLNKGKLFKNLPANQVHSSFLYLNDNFFYPYTSHIHRNEYLKNEILNDESEEENIDEKKSILTEIKNIFSNKENKKFFVENTIIDEIKRNNIYSRIKPINDCYLYLSLLDYDNDLINERNKLLLGFIDKYKIKSNYDKNTYNIYKNNLINNIIINGIIFHSEEKILEKSNIQFSQSILSKSIQNLFPQYELKSIIKDINNGFIQSKYKTLYNFIDKDKSKWNSFVKRIDLDLYNIYLKLKDVYDVNFYSILKKLSMLNIEKLHRNDMIWVSKVIQKNRIYLIKEIEEQKSKLLLKQNQTFYEFIPNTDIFNILCDNYGITDLRDKSYPSELLYIHNLDYGNKLFHIFQRNLSHLKIDFQDQEMKDIVETLNNEISTKSKDNNNLNTIKNEVVKTYVSLQELEGDQGKIVLKDPYGDNSSFQNNTQLLYSLLQSESSTPTYTEPIEVFNKKLQELLVSYNTSLNESQLKDLQLKLFEKRENIFNLLINKIIELKVRPQDRCYVKDTNEYYVYNSDSMWIKENVQEENIRKKKILRAQNDMKDFQLSKESILEDYVRNLIQQLHNERSIEDEKKKIINKNTHEKNSANLIIMKKQMIENILKYNYKKQELELNFDLNEYLSNIIISPYLSLLYNILSIENLDKKYELIQDFISYLTIDIGDKDWYYCAIKKTKLIPKFLNTLSIAYFDGTYDEVIKKICLTDGTLSDSGDCWIHKNTGIKIQSIYFDTNYGYDENGFKIVLDEVTNTKDKIEKIVLLTPEENRFKTIVHAFLNFIGVGLKTSFEKNENKFIKEMYNIFINYKNKYSNANKKEINKRKCYSVVGFLLVYFQCNIVIIRQSYPGCIHKGFEGYPLDNNKENIKGIEYLACILSKISIKNTNPPYKYFNNMKEHEITKELYSFIKNFILKNPYIISIINNKKLVLQQNFMDETSPVYQKLKSFERFLPSLTKIDLKYNDVLTKNVQKKNPFNEYLFYKDLIGYQNVRLQEFFQETIKNELPLLKTQMGHPFLINYCCQGDEFIIKYLCKSKSQQYNYENIQKNIENYTNSIESIYKLYLIPNQISFEKDLKNIINKNEKYVHFNDEIIIYSFFIYYGNFDNDMPIMPFLETFIKEKPNKNFYNSNNNLNLKIKSLKDNGYTFTYDNLITALQFKSKNNANQLFFKMKENNENTDIYSELNSYLNIDLKSSNIETLLQKNIISIEKKITTNLNAMELYSKVKDFVIIKDYLNTAIQYTNIESYISYLNQSIYSLLIIIPQFIINKKLPYTNNVYCDHWNLASKHTSILYEQSKNTFIMFESIVEEIHPESKEYIFINDIISMKKLRDFDEFKNTEMIHFSYLQLVFYKLLYWYSMFNIESTQYDINTPLLKSFNESIYNYLKKIKSFNVEEYKYAKSINKKLKESEKQLIIKSFQNMKKDIREVEDLQKNLGLGKWAYGKGKSFLKYDKKSFDDEERRAGEVHEMMDILYNMEEKDESFILEQTSILEQSSSLLENNTINDPIQEIYNNEQENMILGEEDDERFLENNSYLEDYD